MIRMDIAAVAEVLGGTLVDCPDPAVPVTGAVADSRAAGPGDLYVAIVGERVDGHDFSAAAHAAGAVVTLGSRPTGQPTIVVSGDPVDALGRLASHTLDRLPAARVVAITGSSARPPRRTSSPPSWRTSDPLLRPRARSTPRWGCR